VEFIVNQYMAIMQALINNHHCSSVKSLYCWSRATVMLGLWVRLYVCLYKKLCKCIAEVLKPRM